MSPDLFTPFREGFNLGMDPGEDNDPKFITALARGLEILRSYGPGETELTNTDFAERTGLPRPTVTRLTYTLVKLDYLLHNPKLGCYQLGPGALKLGLSALSASDIGQRSRHEMKALLDGPNDFVSISLGQKHRDEVIYLAVERSTQNVALSLNVGSALPLFSSSVGCSILVGLPEDLREAAFEEAKRADPEGHAKRRAFYENGRAEYESVGYCTSFGQWRGDVNGISVPVFSMDAARVYALTVGGLAIHVGDEQLIADYSAKLVAAGERLSIRLD